MSPAREQIDRDLVEGRPYREIARRHATTKDSLARHHKAHVSPALTRVAQRREERGAETAFRRLEDLYARAMNVLDTAEKAGQTAQQLGAIRELRAVVEVLARVTGELKPEGATVTVNLLQSPEVANLIVVIRDVFGDQPEKLAVVAQRLALPE